MNVIQVWCGRAVVFTQGEGDVDNVGAPSLKKYFRIFHHGTLFSDLVGTNAHDNL